MEWLEPESLLLVFASQNYEATDYIRDYDDFVEFARTLPKTAGEESR